MLRCSQPRVLYRFQAQTDRVQRVQTVLRVSCTLGVGKPYGGIMQLCVTRAALKLGGSGYWVGCHPRITSVALDHAACGFTWRRAPLRWSTFALIADSGAGPNGGWQRSKVRAYLLSVLIPCKTQLSHAGSGCVQYGAGV